MPIELRESWSVEVYLPKKLQYLSELFNYLRSKLSDGSGPSETGVEITGFSLYEVDGAFVGRTVFEERTLVIRILFPRRSEETSESRQEFLTLLANELSAAMQLQEEEIWICQTPLQIGIFRPPSSA